jgi:hypothetical protein
MKLPGAIGLVLALSVPALADDHVIRPTCWEENVNGVPQRHCEVIRDSKSPPVVPQPRQAYVPPPEYVAPPVRPWATQACHYSYPCPVYYDRWPAPVLRSQAAGLPAPAGLSSILLWL